MMVGEDFVIDMLLVIDIITLVIDMMVAMRSLQYPCWKVVPQSIELMRKLKTMAKSLTISSGSALNLDSNLFPLLSAHLDDLGVDFKV